MFSPVTLALVYSVGAGVMNGSFALPTKHIKTWNFEHIWLVYAFFAFLFFPWCIVFLLDPHIGDVYQSMSFSTVSILLIGGLLFGIGQVCFALALRTIGLGLGFVITIGLATGLGSLLPLLAVDTAIIFTRLGLTTLFGVACIVVGLILSFSAGNKRDHELRIKQNARNTLFKLGVFFAVLAGLFSAGQNYVFALTRPIHQLAIAAGADPLTASIVIWPPFLTCSFIPYASYMLYLHRQNRSFSHYRQGGFIQNSLLGMVMAFFWFGSLAIYSKASLLMGNLGPVIAWPLFMVLIILTSHFWSWRHKEWEGCSKPVKRRANVAVMALIFAVLVLTYCANLTSS